MSELGRRTGGWRTLVGVLALYALLLQGLAAEITPRFAPGSDPASSLCVPGHDGAHDPAAPSVPHRHECCLAAVLSAALAAPASDPGLPQAWPTRSVRQIGWTLRLQPPATGPPLTPLTARGPPIA